MSDDKKFQQKLMQEIGKQRALRQKTSSISTRAKLLGAFLKACLDNNQLSETDFARHFQISTETVTTILQGNIPDWLLSDEAIIRMAEMIHYDPNILRIMLERPLNLVSNKDEIEDDASSASGL
jgi:hypothetical protein